MAPVIPKVRPGDVLKSTRHLRRWLRAHSLRRYFQNKRMRFNDRILAKNIYIPSKEDRLVVAVNNANTFVVWGANTNQPFLLFFVNNPGSPVDPVYLAPSNFATWFLRTTEKMADLVEWPQYAYVSWAQLHIGSELHPKFRRNSTPWMFQDPFGLPEMLLRESPHRQDRMQVKQRAAEFIRLGLCRPAFMNCHPYWRVGYGPRLEDIELWEEYIQQQTRNKRTMEQMKAEMNDAELWTKLQKLLVIQEPE